MNDVDLTDLLKEINRLKIEQIKRKKNKRTNKANFDIMHDYNLVSLIASGYLGAKGKVIGYLIMNRGNENELNITDTQLAKELGISRNTTNVILRELIKMQMIKKKLGVIMINPKFVIWGNDDREKRLIKKYEEF